MKLTKEKLGFAPLSSDRTFGQNVATVYRRLTVMLLTSFAFFLLSLALAAAFKVGLPRTLAAIAGLAVCATVIPAYLRLTDNGRRITACFFVFGSMYVAGILFVIAFMGIPRWGIK